MMNNPDAQLNLNADKSGKKMVPIEEQLKDEMEALKKDKKERDEKNDNLKKTMKKDAENHVKLVGDEA